METKTLHLTLKKEPFDVMIAGLKKIEFRKPSNWIKSRLFNKEGLEKEYTHIKFTNGYGSDKPFFTCRYAGVLVAASDCTKSYDRLVIEIEKGDYMILLGAITETGNIN